MFKKAIMLAALVVLAGPGVAQPAQPDPVVTAAQGYQLRLLGGGLAAGRRGLHSYPVFLFGLSRTEAIQRVAALRGRASASGNSYCDANPLNFARFGTLTLWFRNNRWVGWTLAGPPGRRPIRSEYDLGIGTPQNQIGDADADQPVFRRTARGTEFAVEDMHGRLAGRGRQARVAAMWAGTTCTR